MTRRRKLARALLDEVPKTSDNPVDQFAMLVAGTVGFASVGTLFGAMLIRTRTRDVLLLSCCIRSRFL